MIPAREATEAMFGPAVLKEKKEKKAVEVPSVRPEFAPLPVLGEGTGGGDETAAVVVGGTIVVVEMIVVMLEA